MGRTAARLGLATLLLLFGSQCAKSDPAAPPADDPANEPEAPVGVVFAAHWIGQSFTGAIAVSSADLDGDGDLDPLGAGFHVDQLAWWENLGDQTFVKHVVASDFDGARQVFAFDLDGDGDLDVLGAAFYGNAVERAQPGARVVLMGARFIAEHSVGAGLTGANTVHAGDLDADGDVDVVAGSWTHDVDNRDSLVWFENDALGGFTEHVLIAGNSRNSCVRVVDLDGDSDNDIVVAVYGSGTILWLENLGEHTFETHAVASGFGGSHWVYPVDLDSDGDVDVLGAAIEESTVAWWENDGAQHFTRHNIAGFPAAGSVYAADLDADGDVDVLATAESANTVAWWENDGSQAFTRHDISTNEGQALDVHAADLDGDGDVDVLSAAFSGHRIVYWENTLR